MTQMEGDPALAATIDWVLMSLTDPAVHSLSGATRIDFAAGGVQVDGLG